jgi:hypothetical protein
LDLIGPEEVDDFFVGENGVGGQIATAHQHGKQERGRANGKQAPALGDGA